MKPDYERFQKLSNRLNILLILFCFLVCKLVLDYAPLSGTAKAVLAPILFTVFFVLAVAKNWWLENHYRRNLTFGDCWKEAGHRLKKHPVFTVVCLALLVWAEVDLIQS